LANLLQSSSSTFSRVSFLSFFAFKEGMLGTPISVLGGWPTVSPRFQDTIGRGQFHWHNMHGNSVHKSTSSWSLAWKFFDSMKTASPRESTFALNAPSSCHHRVTIGSFFLTAPHGFDHSVSHFTDSPTEKRRASDVMPQLGRTWDVTKVTDVL